jgi:hypothetical protein
MAEYQIKAAFLCKFGNYVAWPSAETPAGANGERPFWIGVVASDAFFQTVRSAAAGQRVEGRPIAVRQLERNDAVDGLDLMFVARSHGGRGNELLHATKGLPILTVTETDAGSDIRGMINFVVIDDKVKFDVQLSVVDASQLRISSRLLSIAHSVTGRSS